LPVRLLPRGFANSWRSWYDAFVFDNAGFVQEAVVHIERAMKLSPIAPPNYLGQLGNACAYVFFGTLASEKDPCVACWSASAASNMLLNNRPLRV